MHIDFETLDHIKKYGKGVIETSQYMQIANYMQHKSTNCLLHSVAVAYISFKIIDFLNLKVNKYELTRSALLHDYFLYDWHDGRLRNGKIHGFCHPKIASENAFRDFNINDNEIKNIKRHMWPLTIIPPTKKEGWIIVTADKFCAIYELCTKKSSLISHDDLRKSKLVV